MHPSPATTRTAWLRLVVALAALALLPGCAGYRFGTGAMFPPGVQTVHVPVFENDTFRRYLGEQMTEAVVKEIEATTPYKVVNAAGADTFLTGRIVSLRKTVLADDINDNPRDIETAFQVIVQWTDRRGDPITPETVVPISLFDLTVTEAAHFVPESGQSIATSQQSAIQRVARQIVSQMNAPW